MNIDNFHHSERYILGLNSEMLERFFLKESLDIESVIGLKGNYLNLQLILFRMYSKLSTVQQEYIVQKIKQIYNEQNNPNIDNNLLLEWLFNASVLVFTAKKLYQDELCQKIAMPYLISIKENNILTLFERNQYVIDKCNIELNKFCNLQAVGIKTTGNYRKQIEFVFIFKSKDHFLCLNPLYKSNLSNFYKGNKYNQNISNRPFKISKFDLELVDEIVDNSPNTYNLDYKIESIYKIDCLKGRTDTMINYFSSDSIPSGEFMDMADFF